MFNSNLGNSMNARNTLPPFDDVLLLIMSRSSAVCAAALNEAGGLSSTKLNHSVIEWFFVVGKEIIYFEKIRAHV